MDKGRAEKIRRLSPLSIYLDRSSLRARLREDLIKACMDRAVLLVEISGAAIVEHFGAKPQEVEKIKRVQRTIYQYENTEDFDMDDMAGLLGALGGKGGGKGSPACCTQ